MTDRSVISCEWKKTMHAERKKRSKPSRRRQAQMEQREEQILASAFAVFAAHGYEAARLDDVARRAGIAKGTIYLYFRDKESLFQEMIPTMLTPPFSTLAAP